MMAAYNKYLLAADSIFILHFLFVAFIVLGLVFIWLGYLAKIKFIRNAKFRICHLIAMGIVVVESLIGMICPLTEWENSLRIKGGQGQVYEAGFVAEWLHKIIFFDLSLRTFIIIYILFFALLLFTFRIIPPDLKKNSL